MLVLCVVVLGQVMPEPGQCYAGCRLRPQLGKYVKQITVIINNQAVSVLS